MNPPAKWVTLVRDWCAEQGVTDVVATEALLRIVYEARVVAQCAKAWSLRRGKAA